MKVYDFIFITNIPAFYKVNLFNQLAQHCSLKVIFISRTSKIRDADFYNYSQNFDAEYICNEDFEDRNPLYTLIKIYKIIKKSQFNMLVFPGWEIKELFFISLLNERKKNAVVIESSINETVMHGYAWSLKKNYLKRMGTAFPSGKLQAAILDKIRYGGEVIITHGVGISNYTWLSEKKLPTTNNGSLLNYLYVGRLSSEKNLISVIKTFNQRKEKLTIVGTGPEEKELRHLAGNNIRFLGYINNKELERVYQAADVFILPSRSEPWGLVIDEALSFSLPIIASNKVGCIDDLVSHGNGLIFDIDKPHSVIECMDKMQKKYLYYAANAQKIDMGAIYQKQVASYLTLKADNEI
ncbi:glycosyltransferase family 4 protein [Erwinia sp. V71]|uniref:glycosyltransferase family 4 protein n=1 Tax=Erwinia sp. V71 TaxID=3369424 RepID=UPI003F61A8FA